ncbi:BRO family protein [Prescottella equi]
MNSLDLLTYAETGDDFRVFGTPDDPTFALVDACKILGLSNPTMAARALDVADLSTTEVSSGGQRRQINVVTEAGLYELIFQSRKPEAKKFRRWITSEVLPSIRRTGSYNAAPALSGPELMAAALVEANKTLALTEARVAQLEPKAAYVEEFVTDEDLLRFDTVASTLGIQEGDLRSLLIRHGWIYKETASRWSHKKGKKVEVNRYSEKSHKKAYFRRVENHDVPRFRNEVMHTLKITAPGAEAIARNVPRWIEEAAA